MKTTFLSLTIMAIFAINSIAQESTLIASTNPEAKQIQWVSTMVNFGTTKVNNQLEAKFEFTNTGTLPVVITNVKPSCGCTGVNYPKEAIAPGKKATITASYKPKKQGNFQKMVTVTTSASSNPVRLKLMGKVE